MAAAHVSVFVFSVVCLAAGVAAQISPASSPESSPFPGSTSCTDLLSYSRNTCDGLLSVSGFSSSVVSNCCGAITLANQELCFCDFTLSSDSTVTGADGTVVINGTQLQLLASVCSVNTSAIAFAGDDTCPTTPGTAVISLV